ncbi:C-type lectin 37Db [Zeugodacus cucurbitae]|uniref:Mannose-binding protein C n=1 Tax=Zeugodacus cucurbitae TaxID=28588 RepID=A0A0A1WGF9_ZEUCU|nr:C-type lectin 37Db [Zeugodacus cucurbitae]
MQITHYIYLLCFAYCILHNLSICQVIATTISDAKPPKYPFTKVGNKYYLINTAETMNWFDAAHFCRTYDSDLITIESPSEMEALAAHLTTIKEKNKRFWTGVNDLAAEGKFVSLTNGRRIIYKRWLAGEPNDGLENEDCVEIAQKDSELYMNDYACAGKWYVICEMRHPPKAEVECDTIPTKCIFPKLMEAYRQSTDIFNCRQ